MKNTYQLSKLKRTIACGVLATLVMAASAAPTFAATKTKDYGKSVNPVNTEYETDAKTTKMPKNESMAEFLKDITKVSKAEKEALIKAETEKAPYYVQMNKLYDEIIEKTNKIVKGASPTFDKIEKIKNNHRALWTKVESKENKAQKKVGSNMIKFIRLSTSVKKAEKAVLIKDQKKINVLYKKVDKVYDAAKKATADKQAELDKVIEKIREIDKKNEAIWNKIYA